MSRFMVPEPHGTGADTGREKGARCPLPDCPPVAQTAVLPRDVFDAISDALADALVADYLANTGANSHIPVQSNESPSGLDHHDDAA